MAKRALIIAIESYAQAAGGALANALPGTLAAGTAFRDWLLKKWQAEGLTGADTQMLFCSEPAIAGGRGAARIDLMNALAELRQAGSNTTEELYFYFSGHGFTFEGVPGTRSDVLVAGDFQNGYLSSGSCLKLDEIVSWLRAHLGFGHHYYFIDACRNVLTPGQVQVANQLPWNPQDSEEATTYVLQSTKAGAPALVAGPFAKTLLLGLNGSGKAKVWAPPATDSMLVKYESLRRFLRERLSQDQPITSRVEGEDGEGDAILAFLKPVPLCQLTVNLRNSPPDASGKVVLKRADMAAREVAFAQQPVVIPLEPGFYSTLVRVQGAVVSPDTEVAVELFDDAALDFEIKTGAPPPPPPPPLPSLPPLQRHGVSDSSFDFQVPRGANYRLRNISTGLEILVEASSQRASLAPGTYAVTLDARKGPSLQRGDLEVAAGEQKQVNPTSWAGSVPHECIARHFPSTPEGLDFSESLQGGVEDPDLSIWLAVLGAGRMLGSYEKINTLPLADFSHFRPGASPLYVLAAFEDPDTSLQVAVSRGSRVTWHNATEPAGLRGLRHIRFSPRPGPLLVSLRIGEQAPFTLASVASPNRGTLLTLTLDDEGLPRISQFLPPLGPLVSSLPEHVREFISSRNSLKDILFLAQASRAFRRRQRLSKALTGRQLSRFLNVQWVDPIGALLAAYELVRRGESAHLVPALSNLRTHFPDLPDIAALSRLCGEQGPAAQPSGVPLFLDGLQAFPDPARLLPLPEGHLDFSAMWTTWQAAVKPPAS